MKNQVNIKSVVLISSFLLSVTIFIFDNSLRLGMCSTGDYDCVESMVTIGKILLFFPLIFIFSLITYLMRQQVFDAWWKFAKYVIPIILVLSTIINGGFHHNPAGQWQDILDVPVLVTLYSIFALGSIIQIVRGYFTK